MSPNNQDKYCTFNRDPKRLELEATFRLWYHEKDILATTLTKAVEVLKLSKDFQRRKPYELVALVATVV